MSQATAIARASNLFIRFKARELARSPSASQTLSELPTYTNPFLSSKPEGAKFHRPSKYSLRRQKELLKAARLLSQTGHDLSAEKLLPPGPKALSRISGGGVNKALAALGRKDSAISVSGKTERAQPISEGEPEVNWIGAPRPRKNHGLYEGRKVAFKLHKWEREQRGRRDAIKKQVQGMDQRIDEWRKVSDLCSPNIYVPLTNLTATSR
jgi:Mitochondrial ribosomal protein mL59